MDDDSLELLANQRLIKKPLKNKNDSNSLNEKNIDQKKFDEKNIDQKKFDEKNIDDNDEILELLKGRLKLGKERYGHGVRVNQNTQDFGTEEDDWELMALEEMLDGLIYTTASIIRYRRNKKNISNNNDKKIIIDNNISKNNISKNNDKKIIIDNNISNNNDKKIISNNNDKKNKKVKFNDEKDNLEKNIKIIK